MDERVSASTPTVPAPRNEAPAGARLRLQVTYGARGSAVVSVAGEVDILSAPRLNELLHCRLRSTLRRLEIELSGVTFMSVAGAQALERAATYAHYNDKELRIDIGGSRAVERVLRATGLRDQLPLATRV